MKKLTLLLPVFCCVFYINLNAQEIAPEIISSSGDYYENANVSLSWTIGESVTETFTNGTNILTQGFQQSRLEAVSVFELEDSDISINIAPNPTQGIIYLYTDNYDNLNYQLYDFNGKIIDHSILYSKETMINFNNLSDAPYFLKIMKGSQIIRTFQIIKQ